MHGLLRALVLVLALTAAARAEILQQGYGHFEFPFQQDGRIKPVTVWTYSGQPVDRDTAVLFVMHGLERAPRSYLRPWVQLVSERNLLLLAPEFNGELFPGSRSYNLGNIRARRDATEVPRDSTYAAIEKIFDFVVAQAQLRLDRYRIYGHSAGAQFVHRLVLLQPKSRLMTAIAANAGWYSLPDLQQRYPYGVADTGLSHTSLAVSLQNHLVILLGEQDNDPDHPSLNRRDRVLQQGAHRLARGKGFFAQAELAASRLNVKLRWQLQTVPGVGHDNAGMAQAASPLLFP